MPFAKNGNIDIYYEVHGQGDWLVLSHEFAGSYKCWRPQLVDFAKESRVVVYNDRGYPPSTVPDKDHSRRRAEDPARHRPHAEPGRAREIQRRRADVPAKGDEINGSGTQG